jgi:nifR3 family TIM-barrel protein
LETDASERPVGVQLFGSNADEVVGAARLLQERFDVIDVNCGCPAGKVIKTGSGSALLNDPAKIAALVKRLVYAVDRPVTVKIRSGIDERHRNAVQVALAAEAAGAAAVTVHGRTARQGYRGKADWDIIREVKNAVRIPVIGNGDVTSPEDFASRLAESSVDYVMIGRGAMGNPYLFRQIDDFLRSGQHAPMTRREQFEEYLALAERHALPFLSIRQQAMWFLKGAPGISSLRARVARAKSLDELRSFIS